MFYASGWRQPSKYFEPKCGYRTTGVGALVAGAVGRGRCRGLNHFGGALPPAPGPYIIPLPRCRRFLWPPPPPLAAQHLAPCTSCRGRSRPCRDAEVAPVDFAVDAVVLAALRVAREGTEGKGRQRLQAPRTPCRSSRTCPHHGCRRGRGVCATTTGR